MPAGPPPDAPRFDHTLLIAATPARVLGAFFDAEALAAWWQAVRSVTTPRPLGVYAIEWDPTTYRDEVLGPLGGVFYGTVIDFRPGQEFFVADAYWLPPDGDPVGPMALHVACALDGPACRLTVRQEGCEDRERWRRYYAVITRGWQTSLAALKHYLEHGGGAADRRPDPASGARG